MYKIVGGDNKEYGPVTAGQLREWIAQNRANANTIVSFQGGPWKPLSTFPEFSDLLRPGTIAGGPPPTYTTSSPSNAPNMFDGRISNWPGVSSLTLGILSIFPCCCTCPVTALIGLVLGIIGVVQIRKNPGHYTTSDKIPIIGIALCVLALIMSIVVFRSPAFEEQFRKFEQELERLR